MDPVYYLHQELRMVSEGDLKKGITPIASLGEDDKRITLKMVHCATFEEGKKQWDRRIKRINPDNFFVKFGLPSNACVELKKSCVSSYLKCKYKKILAYYGDDVDGAFSTDRFIWYETKGRIEEVQYSDYFRQYYFYDVNIFNLLLYGSNYERCR